MYEAIVRIRECPGTKRRVVAFVDVGFQGRVGGGRLCLRAACGWSFGQRPTLTQPRAMVPNQTRSLWHPVAGTDIQIDPTH
jgi:hypothetical protein